MTDDRESWTAYARDHGLIQAPRMALELEAPPVPAPGANKYHARRVTVDGVTFASRREAGRYLELRLREKAGEIEALELQPVFPLYVMEIWRSQAPIVLRDCGVYTADFRYCDLQSGEIIVEDVKSDATKTTDYRLRKTVAEAVHGMTITEIE